MKKIILAVGLFGALSLSGCGAKQDCKLLENASPETSAMSIYYFDGENTNINWIYDVAEEQKIISEINNLKTKSVDKKRISEMNVSSYGIEIVDKDGYEIWLTYSNGLWLLKDGSVYEAKYNFKQMYDNLKISEPDIVKGGLHMLNSAYLGEYDIRYYEKSDDLSDTKDGVTMSISSVEEKSVTVKFDNNSENEFFYGEYFTLQKKIDDEWYTIPVKLSNYGFNDLGYILKPHESNEMVCDLTPYGELESEMYRIEKEGIVAEFEIT